RGWSTRRWPERWRTSPQFHPRRGSRPATRSSGRWGGSGSTSWITAPAQGTEGDRGRRGERRNHRELDVRAQWRAGHGSNCTSESGGRVAVAPRWESIGCDPSSAAALAAALNIAPVVAALLCQRGLSDPEQASRFLNPSLAHLHDPMALAGMSVAVDRVLAAI